MSQGFLMLDLLTYGFPWNKMTQLANLLTAIAKDPWLNRSQLSPSFSPKWYLDISAKADTTGHRRCSVSTQVYMVLTHLPRLTNPHHMKDKAIYSIFMGRCCLELIFLYKARLINLENRCDIQVMSLKSVFKRTSAETFPAPAPPLELCEWGYCVSPFCSIYVWVCLLVLGTSSVLPYYCTTLLNVIPKHRGFLFVFVSLFWFRQGFSV